MLNKPLIVLLTILLAAPSNEVYADDAGATIAASNWVKAVKSGNVNAVVRCYASDATLWVSGAKTAKGSNQIRAVYKNYLAKYAIKEAVLTPMGSETVGNESVAWGTYKIVLLPKTTVTPIVSTGRYTDVVMKSGDTWTLLVDHASDDPPSPAAK